MMRNFARYFKMDEISRREARKRFVEKLQSNFQFLSHKYECMYFESQESSTK